jgi:protein-glutamine gamma-glutamyltransferase
MCQPDIIRMVKYHNNIRIHTIVNVLTYLVGIISFVSVCTEIHIACIALFTTIFIFSLYFTYKQHFLIPRWILNAISIIIVLLSLYRFNVNDLITQMLEALLVLLAIKLLEKKRARDYMQIYAISLLIVAGSGLLTLSIAFIVYFFLLILLLTLAAVFLAHYTQDPCMELGSNIVIKIVTSALLILSLSAPFTVFLFIILPRTNYPFLNFLNRQERAHTGFSDQVKLGAVSSIQEDSAAIMRVNMDKIDESNLYWRGLVLDYFNGTTWKNSSKVTALMTKQTAIPGTPVTQTIYLEPYENRYLFALDKPVFISYRHVKQLNDAIFISSIHLTGRIRYEARSLISDTIIERDIDRERFTQLPANISSEITSLVRGLSKGKDEAQAVQTIYQFLNSGTFTYSLKNLPITNDPLETFFFKTRYGNCEYFASAFAVMLRIINIPARLVAGYKGGYYNNVGNYYLIPQKNAHVWVEVYLRNKGWLRIDPTPASMDEFVFIKKGAAFSKIGFFFDAINYYWYAFVINYDFEKQISFVFKIRTAFKNQHFNPSFNKTIFIQYAFLLVLFSFIVLSIYNLLSRQKSVEKRLLVKFLRKMERLGYSKEASQGLEEFASSIEDSQVRVQVFEFVKEFEALYFKDSKFNANDVQKLKTLIRAIGS